MPKSKRDSIEKIFNLNYARSFGRGYDLKVELKKSKKGVSLFAKKKIKKGNIVAYYRFKIYREPHRTLKGSSYAMAVYTKKGNPSRTLIGDIYPGSLDVPKRNISFWAYFSNEPSRGQEENAKIDDNIKSNYRNRRQVKKGDVMTY